MGFRYCLHAQCLDWMCFLSNNEEGLYLNWKDGQNNMASAISSAIIVYKKEYFRTQSNRNSDELPSRKTTENGIKDSSKNSKLKRLIEKRATQKGELRRQNSDVVFKVQFAAGNKNIKLNPSNFRGLRNVAVRINDGSFYKYGYDSKLDYNSAKEDLKEVKSKGYSFA